MKIKITIFLAIILTVQISTHLVIRSSHSAENTIDSKSQTSGSSGGGASANQSVSDTDNRARILRGKEIFDKMDRQQILGNNPRVSGQLTEVPTLSLFIDSWIVA